MEEQEYGFLGIDPMDEAKDERIQWEIIKEQEGINQAQHSSKELTELEIAQQEAKKEFEERLNIILSRLRKRDNYE